jgi:transcriptional regulator with XRE-family HTH domain
MSPQTALGNLLKTRRAALGYSRTRLGALLGIPPGTIEGWELGRVAKPPLHDVLKMARFLGISSAEIEAAVLDAEEPETPPRPASPGTGALPLLEQAIALFGWDDEQAAAALGTEPTRIRAWLEGRAEMTLPEIMTVAALVGLHAAGRPADLPRVRRSRA